jgi:hypothetical protein
LPGQTRREYFAQAFFAQIDYEMRDHPQRKYRLAEIENELRQYLAEGDGTSLPAVAPGSGGVPPPGSCLGGGSISGWRGRGPGPTRCCRWRPSASAGWAVAAPVPTLPLSRRAGPGRTHPPKGAGGGAL